MKNGGMTTTFFFRQNVGFCLEFRVRGNGTWLAENLTTLNFFTLGTTQKNTNVVACLAAIKQLAEHFNTGAGGFLGWFDTDDFDFFTNLDDATFYTTGNNRTTTRDRENVFDWQQERKVNRAFPELGYTRQLRPSERGWSHGRFPGHGFQLQQEQSL